MSPEIFRRKKEGKSTDERRARGKRILPRKDPFLGYKEQEVLSGGEKGGKTANRLGKKKKNPREKEKKSTLSGKYFLRN